MISVQEWLDDPEFAEQRKQHYGVKLNCGHLPSDPAFIYDSGRAAQVGYGRDSQGRKYCFDCCAEQDKAVMKREGKIDLYLTERGGNLVVTTWPGKVISQRVKLMKTWRSNFGDTRVSVRFTFSGEIWSGIGAGPGMYLRCKRTKYTRLEE